MAGSKPKPKLTDAEWLATQEQWIQDAARRFIDNPGIFPYEGRECIETNCEVTVTNNGSYCRKHRNARRKDGDSVYGGFLKII